MRKIFTLVFSVQLLLACYVTAMSAATIINPDGTTVTNIFGSKNSSINSTGGDNEIMNMGSVLVDVFGSWNTGDFSSGSGNLITNQGTIGENIFGSFNFGTSSSGGANTIDNAGTVGIDIIGTYNRGDSTSGGNNMIDNSGSVNGDILGSWNTGDMSSGGGNTIGNQGTVGSDIFGSYNFGTSSSGDSNTILNTGTVGEDIIGSYNRGSSCSGGGNRIDNAGMVNGDVIGSWNSGDASSSNGNTIFNSGVVSGNIYGSLNQGNGSSGGDDFISNSGSVGGSIYGGDGNDTVIFAAGSFLGGIADGGSGADTLGFNNMGTIDGNVLGTTYNNFENLGFFGGTTNLTGVWNMSGGSTTIYAGNLYINGNLSTTRLTVNPGSLFGGSGIVNGAVINYGTISPGNSIGTLTVSNGVSFMPGSLYLVELQADGAGDLLRATGTVRLNGGSVKAILYRGLYVNGQQWQIISAGGGVNGIFSSMATNMHSQTLDLRLVYDSSQVLMEAVRTPFSELGVTPNQKSAGAGFDAVVPFASGDMASLIISMDFDMNLGQIRDTLNALGPEMYTAFGQAGLHSGKMSDRSISMRQENVRMREHFDVAAQKDDQYRRGWSLWTRALGNMSKFDADDNYIRYDQDITGIIVGADGGLNSWLLGGLSVGYSDSDLEWDGFGHSGSSQGIHAGMYTTAELDGFFIDGYLGYAGFDNSAARDIVLRGFSARTGSDFDSDLWQGRIKGGYDFSFENWLLSPFASVQYAKLEQDDFTESGANYLNLRIREKDVDSFSSSLGIRFSGLLEAAQWQFLPSIAFGWLHEYEDESPALTANFAGYDSSPFIVTGQDPVSDLGTVDVGLVGSFGRSLSMYLDYGLAFADGYQSHSISCGLAWQF